MSRARSAMQEKKSLLDVFSVGGGCVCLFWGLFGLLTEDIRLFASHLFSYKLKIVDRLQNVDDRQSLRARTAWAKKNTLEEYRAWIQTGLLSLRSVYVMNFPALVTMQDASRNCSSSTGHVGRGRCQGLCLAPFLLASMVELGKYQEGVSKHGHQGRSDLVRR